MGKSFITLISLSLLTCEMGRIVTSVGWNNEHDALFDVEEVIIIKKNIKLKSL